MKTKCDVEFIKGFNDEMGAKYENAKRLYKVAPLETLIILRSLASDICSLLLSELGEEVLNVSIFDLVDKLESTKHVNQSVIDGLNLIRLAGNKAAHPEQFSLKQFDFFSLAKKTSRDFCETIELIQSSFQGIEPISYNFLESTEEEDLKDLSYRGFFKNDAQAKFDLASALMQKRNQRLDELINSTNNQTLKTFYLEDDIRKILHLLESTSNSLHIDSHYLLGYIYLNGLDIEVDITKAIDHLRFAAYSDHNQAKACLGELILKQKDSDDTDIKEALTFLDESARKGDALALNTLSKVYSEGELVEKDLDYSLELLIAAADLGYSESQFKLAEFYLTTGDLENYWKYIEHSISADYLEAFLSKGRVLARQSQQKMQSDKAIYYYREYIKYIDNPEVRYELGELIIKNAENNPDEIKQGLYELICSYQNPNCNITTKRKIEKNCPIFLKKINKLFIKLSLSQKEKDNWTAFYCHFSAKGIPFESNKKMGDLLSNIGNRKHISLSERQKEVMSTFYMPQRKQRPFIDSKKYQKIGRNKVCPLCRSGKKYKHCCAE